MRDLLILAIFGVGLFYALRDPFAGLIVFMWISIMNPHRYGWGVTYSLPLALAASAVTMLSMAIHMNQVRIPRTRELFLFFLLWIWITLTTNAAFYPDYAWGVWETVTKIFVMTLVAMLLVNSRRRLLIFLASLVTFVGLIGVKGAVFGLLTAGQHRVWGPPDSFLEDNNSLALAMVMVLPLSLFLRVAATKKWQKLALLGISLSLIVSVLLTYSRGGMLGLVGVGGVSLMYSRHKIRIGLALVVLLSIGLAVMPGQWFDRMNTLKTYEEDDSANMRLNSWTTAYNLAKDNLLGGGFDCFSMDVYYRYSPNPELGRTKAGNASTAHSIYFEVIAMHGFIGLAIFLSCLVSILLSMRKTAKRARDLPHADVAVALSRAFTASTIGFLVSGAFLSRAFFDLYWAIFAAATCLKFMVMSGAWGEESEVQPAPTSKPERIKAVGQESPGTGDLQPSPPAG